MRSLLLLAVLALSSCAELQAWENPEHNGRTYMGMQQGMWEYYYLEPRPEGDSGRPKRAQRPDGTQALRAKGKYQVDRQIGPWTYYFKNGNPQWELTIENEAFQGPTRFYHENGQLLASGSFDHALKSGAWAFWDDAGVKRAEGRMDAGRRSGEWSYWDSASRPVAKGQRDGDECVERWTFWRDDGTTFTTDFAEGSAQPSAELLAQINARPRVPIQPQPRITMLEEELLDYLVDLYTVGREQVENPSGPDFPLYEEAAGAGKAPSYGGSGPNVGQRILFSIKKEAELVGMRLPWRFVYDVNGEEVDLTKFGERGRRAVLVVLRGQTDEVCIYCKAQTAGLANKREDFELQNTDVIIVYPGSRDHLDAFLASYRREFGDEYPGFLWTYDLDFELIHSLDVRHEFAWPTTLVLDEDSVIRFAYVGQYIDARPSSGDLIDDLASLDPR